jgi:hypothetical protein
MDPLALIAAQNAITSPSQHNAFYNMVQSLNPVDPNGNIRRGFDVLKGNNITLLHPYDVLYSCVSKEHQLDDDFEFAAAMAAVILISRFCGNFLYDSI